MEDQKGNSRTDIKEQNRQNRINRSERKIKVESKTWKKRIGGREMAIIKGPDRKVGDKKGGAEKGRNCQIPDDLRDAKEAE